MGHNSVVIDIGRKFAKIAVIQGGKKCKVLRCTTVNLRDGGFPSETLGANLSKALDQVKAKGLPVYAFVSVGTPGVVTKIEYVPSDKPSEIEDYISGPMEGMVKDELDSYYTAWQFLGANTSKVVKENEKFSCQVALIKKELVDFLQGIFKDRNMQFMSLDLNTNALQHVAKVMLQYEYFPVVEEEEANLLIDVGGITAKVVAMSNDSIIGTLNVAHDISKLNKYISDTMPEILEALKEEGRADVEINKVKEALPEMLKFSKFITKDVVQYPDVLDLLVNDIFRNCGGLNSKGKHIRVKNIVLTGGNWKLPGLLEALQDKFGCTCSALKLEDVVSFDTVSMYPSQDGYLVEPHMFTSCVFQPLKGVK